MISIGGRKRRFWKLRIHLDALEGFSRSGGGSEEKAMRALRSLVSFVAARARGPGRFYVRWSRTEDEVVVSFYEPWGRS